MACKVLNSSSASIGGATINRVKEFAPQKNYDKQLHLLGSKVDCLEKKAPVFEAATITEFRKQMDSNSKNLLVFWDRLQINEKSIEQALKEIKNQAKVSEHSYESMNAEVSLLNDNVEFMEKELLGLQEQMKNINYGADLVKSMTEQQPTPNLPVQVVYETKTVTVIEKQFPTLLCFIVWLLTFGKVVDFGVNKSR
jgi:chromosome segregation ATPase